MKVLGMPLGLESEEPLTWGSFARGAGMNILLVVVAGLLTALLFPPYELWWLGWVALVPLLVALRRTREVRAAGWLTLLFGLVFFSSALPWITTIFGGVAVGVFVLMALPLVLFGLGYRLLVRQGQWWVAPMAAVLWVAVDWVRCEGWYFQFSWCQLGTSFAAAPHGAPFFASIGVYGITALILLVNAILAGLFTAKTPWRARIPDLVRVAILLGVCTGILLLPLPKTAPSGDTLRVVMVQGETGDFDYFLKQTRALKGEHPDLVVWPEFALAMYAREDERTMQALGDLAREMRAVLVLGTKEHVPADHPVDWLRRRSMLLMEGDIYANAALVISPAGQVLGTYHKQHPIQFFSDGVPGRKSPIIPTPLGTLGVGICYDFDYAMTAVRMVHGGAELLVVPTFDATTWGNTQHAQHGRIAQARAAEAGRWVVRVTSSGETMLIGPDGHPTATIPNNAESAIAAVAAPRTGLTPYMRWAFALPYFCLALALLWAIGQVRTGFCAWRARRKTTP